MDRWVIQYISQDIPAHLIVEGSSKVGLHLKAKIQEQRSVSGGQRRRADEKKGTGMGYGAALLKEKWGGGQGYGLEGKALKN